MPPSRTLSFPLSHHEEQYERPLVVKKSDATRLVGCEAFRSIRDLLACRGAESFCPVHTSTNTTDADAEREAWLLQRDITFALVFPILEVYARAVEVAMRVLGGRDEVDLELVFWGEARGAFGWLGGFITVENEWCNAEGCPACVVCHVLQSEPTIRMIITACRLASSIRRPIDFETPHDIPIFDFWVTSLAHALQKDPFYGRDAWKQFGERAKGLERGIYAMAQQCCQLEQMPTPTSSCSCSDSDNTPPASPIATSRMRRLGDHRKITGKMTSVREEDVWMQKIILGCWTTLLADAKQQRAPKAAVEKDTAGPSRPPSALRSSSV